MSIIGTQDGLGLPRRSPLEHRPAQLVAQPLVIAMLAVPILIQVYFNAGASYLLNRRLGQARRARRSSRLGLGGQNDRDARHAGNGPQRSLRRITKRRVGGGLATIDFQSKPRAILGHDQTLNKTGGDKPLAGNRIDDGVQGGDNGGAFDQGGLQGTCRR